MIYFTLILFIILVWLIVDLSYQYLKDQKLLKTVTENNRGTKTERKMIIYLLKSGIPHQTIFHDLYLKKSNNQFCQIDIAVATKVGIFVFEIKEYNGWIFGKSNQTYWTQILNYGKHKYRFYNPILQNKKHIEDLKDQLTQFQSIPFYSFVVFFGDCILKNLDSVPINTFVLNPFEALKVVNQLLEQNEPANYTNKREIVNLLKSAHLNGENENIRLTHIKNIERHFGT